MDNDKEKMSDFYKQNCVYRKAMEQDLVIPTYQSQASEENYEGATVIDPIKGRLSQTVHNFTLDLLFPTRVCSYFVPVKPVFLFHGSRVLAVRIQTRVL
jgi:hypothetical protein